jgi:acyl dehydratase
MKKSLGMDASGHAFDDVAVGDTFSRSITITDTHLVLGAGLIGDFNPHHVNDEYAKGSRFGTRILHGMLTSAVMGRRSACTSTAPRSPTSSMPPGSRLRSAPATR